MSRDETLESALSTIFRELLTGICTAMVAEVVSFDGKNRISVQPVVKIKPVDNDEMPLPVLQDVPILFFGGSNFRITYPVAVGDEVLLICAQRDISNWKSNGGVVSPATLRRFSASDAVAIGGLQSFASAGDVGTSFKIENAAGDVFEMGSDGIVTVGDGNDDAAVSSTVDSYFTIVDSTFKTLLTAVDALTGGVLRTTYDTAKSASFGSTTVPSVAADNLKLDKP